MLALLPACPAALSDDYTLGPDQGSEEGEGGDSLLDPGAGGSQQVHAAGLAGSPTSGGKAAGAGSGGAAGKPVGHAGSSTKPPAPSCSDGHLNGGESDVDCGHVCSALCGKGKKCKLDADCQSRDCHKGACKPSKT